MPWYACLSINPVGTLDDAGEINKVELGFNLSWQYCSDSAALVRAMGRAANLGVRSVNIYNYGMLSLNRLEWIKQATRYAQREAS